jgi:hypothetical protein
VIIDDIGGDTEARTNDTIRISAGTTEQQASPCCLGAVVVVVVVVVVLVRLVYIVINLYPNSELNMNTRTMPLIWFDSPIY